MSQPYQTNPTYDDHTAIPLDLARNAALSFEARGLAAYLISYADQQLRIRDLVPASPAGQTQVRRIVRELEVAGLVTHDHRTGVVALTELAVAL